MTCAARFFRWPSRARGHGNAEAVDMREYMEFNNLSAGQSFDRLATSRTVSYGGGSDGRIRDKHVPVSNGMDRSYFLPLANAIMALFLPGWGLRNALVPRT